MRVRFGTGADRASTKEGATIRPRRQNVFHSIWLVTSWWYMISLGLM